MDQGTIEPPPVVGEIEQGTPAASVLKPGDAVVAVDGKRLTGELQRAVQAIGDTIDKHKGTQARSRSPRRRGSDRHAARRSTTRRRR